MQGRKILLTHLNHWITQLGAWSCSIYKQGALQGVCVCVCVCACVCVHVLVSVNLLSLSMEHVLLLYLHH